jgi:hypothetical protein
VGAGDGLRRGRCHGKHGSRRCHRRIGLVAAGVVDAHPSLAGRKEDRGDVREAHRDLPFVDADPLRLAGPHENLENRADVLDFAVGDTDDHPVTAVRPANPASQRAVAQFDPFELAVRLARPPRPSEIDRVHRRRRRQIRRVAAAQAQETSDHHRGAEGRDGAGDAPPSALGPRRGEGLPLAAARARTRPRRRSIAAASTSGIGRRRRAEVSPTRYRAWARHSAHAST